MKKAVAYAAAAAISVLAGTQAASAQQNYVVPPEISGPPAIRLPAPATPGLPVTAPAETPIHQATPLPAPETPPETAGETRSVTIERGNAPQPPAARETAQGSAYAAGMVLEGTAAVHDGHSLSVAGHPVRLHGAEAPGLNQPCSLPTGGTWQCGERARALLSALAHGKTVRCTVTEPAGHGAAASCSTRDSADLGLAMVLSGLAVPNGHDAGRYSRAAENARSSRAGMWAGRFDPPWQWRSANP